MRPLAVLFAALPSTASAAVVRADIVVHVSDQPEGADAPVAEVLLLFGLARRRSRYSAG